MKSVSIDEADESGDSEISRHELTEPLGTTHVAINYYRLAPEEGLPGGLHTHMDQEEVFVVIEGKAAFEMYPSIDAENEEGKTVTINAGEAIRFAPGEFRSGKNESDDELVILALGAPRDSNEVRFPVDCPDCGLGELGFEMTDDGPLFVCPECDTERLPDPCPDCGEDGLHVELSDENRSIVVCGECGAEFDTPPTTRLSGGTE
ncbi:hypothetical protein A4G99_01140 [Haladaptatus sp. R4]|uniref:cupin domain-containing protein n=1 Tax=Haladaptatus sp. R4 TaxID=1679489 RepID=UPI0007B4E7E6|nr:cupin domain-containing protein [Haladaptatus sp. R4]KZN25900.1 hypothetical protein A4G99_01140 [Haladaptatus sp. R4]